MLAWISFWIVAWSGETVALAQDFVPASFRMELDELQKEAIALGEIARTDAVASFLEATQSLEPVETRVIHYRRSPWTVLSDAQFEELGEEDQQAFTRLEWGTPAYYAPMFGTSLAYTRVLDVVAESADLDSFEGTSLFDFGYGGVCHLRLLALNGARVVGVDVDKRLPALYCHPSDQGVVEGEEGVSGHLTLVDGHWPGGEGVAEKVGGDFDFIVSKNVLKRGYVNPREPIAKGIQINLGVEDDQFLEALFESLRPGGLFLIYNIGSKPSGPGEKYRPQDDIGSPFDEEAWREAGFEIVIFDRDDTDRYREYASRYHYYSQRPGSSDRLYAMFTLVRRAAEDGGP